MEKAIEEIIRSYLRHEAESGHNTDLAQLPKHQTASKANRRRVHNAEKPLDSTDSQSESIELEQEFIQALYKCLEDKGVLREVQSFIRQRLVLILKDAWPKLVETRIDEEDKDEVNENERQVTLAVLSLIEDFLCTRKLLFTFSVFSTECIHDGFAFKGDFGKMAAEEAEQLLFTLNIPKDSVQSRTILNSYFSQANWSLLEAIIMSISTNDTNWRSRSKSKLSPRVQTTSNEHDRSLDDKLQQIDYKYAKILTSNSPKGRLSRLLTSKDLETNKEVQQSEMFKSADMERIRDEIETKLKFEFLQKEKALLKNYEDKVEYIRKCAETEKQIWLMEKFNQDQGLLEPRRSNTEILTQTAQRSSLTSQLFNNKLGPVPYSRISNGPALVPPSGRPGLMPDRHVSSFQSTRTPTNEINEAIGAESNPAWKHFNSNDELIQLRSATLKREMERNYLLKEAALRNTISKLEVENQKLKSLPSLTPSKKESVDQSIPAPSGSKDKKGHPSEDEDDARAFLQYTVECQAEQIQQLRQAIKQITSTKINSSPPPSLEGDLGIFLEASKQRCNEIQAAATFVKDKMNQFQTQKNSIKRSPRNSRMDSVTIARFPPNSFPSLFASSSPNIAEKRSVKTLDPKIPVPEPQSIIFVPDFIEETITKEPERLHPQQAAKSTLSVEVKEERLKENQEIQEPAGNKFQQPFSANNLQQNGNVHENDQISESGDIKLQSTHSNPASANLPKENETNIASPSPKDANRNKAFTFGALIRDKIPSSSEDEISARSSIGSTKHRSNLTVTAGAYQDKDTDGRSSSTQAQVRKAVEKNISSKDQHAADEPPPPPKSLALSLLDDILEMETGQASDEEDEDDLF